MQRTLWLWLTLTLIACTTPVVTPINTPMATPTATPVPTPEPYSVAGFEAFLQEATAARAQDRNWLVSNYLAGEPQTPLTG